MPSVEERLQAASRQLALRAAFGKRLTSVRTTAGLTVETLHERTGLTVANITKAEKGRMDPRLSMIDSLAEALGEPLGTLINDLIPGDESRQVDRAP